MGSSRLPGKVLKELAGKPVIDHVIDRVAAATTIDRVLVITSIDPNNLPLIHHVSGRGTGVFVGSENDVLDRYYQAAQLTEGDHFVRVTADCPVIDPVLIDSVVSEHLRTGNSYTSNTAPPTWPDGLDVEAFSRTALETAWTEATLSHDREHVTPYIRTHADRFPGSNVASEIDYSHHRWTLDEQRDYQFLEAVFQMLERPDAVFGRDEIFSVLEAHPEILKINNQIERNAGSR
jgi:spore coat polysaccharide biosynthesis protein SpsF (cytidylyltransferase family)